MVQGNTNQRERSGHVVVRLADTFLEPLVGTGIEWVKQTIRWKKPIHGAKFSNCEPTAQYELLRHQWDISGGANRVDQWHYPAQWSGGGQCTRFHCRACANHPVLSSCKPRMQIEVRLGGPIGAQVQALIVCTANCFAVSIDAPTSRCYDQSINDDGERHRDHQ